MPNRWTWARIREVLIAKGYTCVKHPGRGHGHFYEIAYPDGGSSRLFDTVEEVRDAYGFHSDEGEG